MSNQFVFRAAQPNPHVSTFIDAVDRFLRMYDGDKVLFYKRLHSCLLNKRSFKYEEDTIKMLTDHPEIILKYECSTIDLEISITDSSIDIDSWYDFKMTYVLELCNIEDILKGIEDKITSLLTPKENTVFSFTNTSVAAPSQPFTFQFPSVNQNHPFTFKLPSK